MRIALKGFGGMLPKSEPHLIPENSAQDAVNVLLEMGSLQPLKLPAYVANLAKIGEKKSIYRFGAHLDDDAQYWFHWLNDADVVRGPIPDDVSERTYYTEVGQPPKVTDATIATGDTLMPTASYLLGIPAPTLKAIVTVTEHESDDDQKEENGQADLERQVCYLAYTFVSGWGEEGAPNEVSESFNAMTGDVLNVSGMEGPPSGAYNITHKRLYVSITDANGTATLRFWKEIPAGETDYSAELDQTVLGEALPEFALTPPPKDLFGMMAHPGGFMVGFSGQQVYRSEPFKPYGWPHYSPVADDIVGGAIIGTATVICTKGGTYMATQVDPVSMTPQRLEGSQPCVAKRTIKVFKGGVVYASPDGLVLVDGSGGLTVATAAVLTREQWQAYKPESMHAEVHDNRYYCWFNSGTEKGCLILDVGADGTILTRSDLYVTAAYNDGRRDELFVALEDGNLYKWDGGAPMTYQWVSRRIILERPQNIGAVQVVANRYPVKFSLSAMMQTDSGPQEVQITSDITHARPVRLPGHYRAREFVFTLQASSTITEVTLASILANITAE